MADTQAQTLIEKPVDEVWRRIGDFGDLSWIPNATPARLDGDIRSFQLGDSLVRHRLLRHDDSARSYTYVLATADGSDSGEPARTTEATLSVIAHRPDASIVTWSSNTGERRGSSEGLGAFFQRILDHLKTELEHA